MLAHEYHHRDMRDPLRQAGGRALSQALFFMPVLRRLHERYGELAELTADAAALRATDGAKPPLRIAARPGPRARLRGGVAARRSVITASAKRAARRHDAAIYSDRRDRGCDHGDLGDRLTSPAERSLGRIAGPETPSEQSTSTPRFALATPANDSADTGAAIRLRRAAARGRKRSTCTRQPSRNGTQAIRFSYDTS